MVLPAFIFASWASSKVNSTFNMYSNEYSRSGLTGADVARKVLDEQGLNHIRIERVKGKLTDHYDPKNNVIRLSSAVYDSTSVAAIGVACHEVGHAIQYKEGYFDFNNQQLGQAFYNEDEVIDAVERIISSDFNITEEQDKYISDFFELYDNKNCERTYEAILKVEKGN